MDLDTIINNIKCEFNYAITNICNENIYNLVSNIQKHNENNIYITGIGKSKNIAIHFSELLKSISINAFYIDSINSLHGDIGNLKSNDLCLFISKSGNTPELINLVNCLKTKHIKTIGICCCKNSIFKDICDDIIVLPMKNEISGNNNLIPTNSIMIFIIFINIIISILKNNITLDNYLLNHPHGDIGFNNKQIKDLIIYDFPYLYFKNKCKLIDILLKMTEYKMGIVVFLDDLNNVIGIITDGDIRRLHIKNDNLKTIKRKDINQNFIYEVELNKYINKLDKTVQYIPILKDKKQILGIAKII